MENDGSLKKFSLVEVDNSSIKRIPHPVRALNALASGESLIVPFAQRVSFNGTIQKLSYTSKKRFSCTKINSECFSVKRIDNIPIVDSSINVMCGPLPVQFRMLGDDALFVNSISIEILSGISYQDWKRTDSAKSFLSATPKDFLAEGGYFPDFMIHHTVAVEYAKTCKLPMSAFIAEQSNIILQNLNQSK